MKQIRVTGLSARSTAIRGFNTMSKITLTVFCLLLLLFLGSSSGNYAAASATPTPIPCDGLTIVQIGGSIFLQRLRRSAYWRMDFGFSRHAQSNANGYSYGNCNCNCYRHCHSYSNAYGYRNCHTHANTNPDCDSYATADADTKVQPLTWGSSYSGAETVTPSDWREVISDPLSGRSRQLSVVGGG